MPKNSILLLLLSLGGLTAQTDPYLWNSAAFGGAGFVSGIIVSTTEKNLIYARTDVGGAYRWKPEDRSWIPLLDWVPENRKGYMGVESIAIDPGDTRRVYMLVGTSYWDNGKSAILRSDDYGGTFEITDTTGLFKAHGNGMGRQTGERLAVDPNDGRILFCGTRWNGLFRSDDRGKSWKPVGTFPSAKTPNENGICFVVFDPRSGSSGRKTRAIFAGLSRTGENLYMSTDAGKKWVPVPGRPTDLMPQRAALASDGTLYVSYGSEAGPWNTKEGGVWKLDTKSGRWTEITPAGFEDGRAFGGIAVDPSDPRRVVCSTINSWLDQGGGAWGDKMFLSTDAGVSWKDIVGTRDPAGIPWIGTRHAIHWAGSIEFDPFDTKRIFVVSGNGIFRTDDADAEQPVWNFSVKGLEETVPLDLVSLPGGPVVTAVGDYDGCSYTNTTAYGVIHDPQMGSTSGVAFAAKKPDVLVRVGKEAYRSEDRAKTWKKCGPLPVEKAGYGKVALSADAAVILWSPDRQTKTFRSVDKGQTWTAVEGLSFRTCPVADPIESSVFYAYDRDSGDLFKSTDQGRTFVKTSSPGAGASDLVRCVPDRTGDLWIASPSGLLRSTDAAGSFVRVSGPSSCRSVGFGKVATGSQFPAVYIWGVVGGVEGLFRSDDEAKTWIRINDDRHQFGGPGNAQFVTGDADRFGRVYMSTVGRGVIFGEPRIP